jgi:plastocyanin
VAVATGSIVRAFKLGGTIRSPAARPAATAAPGTERFVGPVEEAEWIETTTILQDLGANGGVRSYVDEYAFKPYRTRARTGERVTWGNNGKMTHTVAAENGSWTTGPLRPGQSVSLIFDKPGVFAYICKDHPWAYGQLVVEDTRSTQTGMFTAQQAARGQTQYNQACSRCHAADLSGSGPAPGLVGAAFMTRWSTSRVIDLFTRIRSTMPPDARGSLGDQAYFDIVAHLLHANEFPEGAADLGAGSGALERTVTR